MITNRTRTITPLISEFTPVPSGVLPHKCACGQPTVAGAECRKKHASEALLRKTRHRFSFIPHASEDPSFVHEGLRSLGQPLDVVTGAFMEPRIGHDFSHVPIPRDAKAVDRGVIQYLANIGQQRNGFRNHMAVQRATPFRARHPLKGMGPDELMARHQNQSLGVTYCDRTSGTLKVPPLAEHCAGDCVAQHEKAHQDDAVDAECCGRLKACLDYAGPDEVRQAACDEAYKKWINSSVDRAECLGYSREEMCLSNLISKRCKGTKPTIGKVAVGLLGAVGGFLAGLHFGGLLGAVAGSLLGGWLGWKAGGVINPDCCDSLRKELDAVTKEKEKTCSQAIYVPCPFRQPGDFPVNTETTRMAKHQHAKTEMVTRGKLESKKMYQSVARRRGTHHLRRDCACSNVSHDEAEGTERNAKREAVLQRVPSTPTPVHEVPPIVHEVLHSPGHPLDSATREFFEPKFGHDFSQVRVHKNGRAAESAQAVNAQAYTVGRNIVFADSHYAPQTEDGKKLMAHELTHVVQQAGSQVLLQRKEKAKTPPASTEKPSCEQSVYVFVDAPVKYPYSSSPGRTPVGPVTQAPIPSSVCGGAGKTYLQHFSPNLRYQRLSNGDQYWWEDVPKEDGSWQRKYTVKKVGESFCRFTQKPTTPCESGVAFRGTKESTPKTPSGPKKKEAACREIEVTNKFDDSYTLGADGTIRIEWTSGRATEYVPDGEGEYLYTMFDEDGDEVGRGIDPVSLKSIPHLPEELKYEIENCVGP